MKTLICFMKRAFVCCLLFLCGALYAQNDSCIQIRWLAVDVNTTNAYLFDMRDNTSFYSLFFELIKTGEQIVFVENDDILDKWNKNYPVLDSSPPKHTVSIVPGSVYENESGDEQVVSCGGGMACWVIPRDSSYYFDPSLIAGFRIREERFFDSTQQVFSWKITGINAYSTYFEILGTPFWIDVQRMLSKLEDPQKYAWYSYITERKYIGEQYMQLSCRLYEYGKLWR